MAPRTLAPAVLGLGSIAAVPSALAFTNLIPPHLSGMTVMDLAKQLPALLSTVSLRSVLKWIGVAAAPPFLAWLGLITGLSTSPFIQRHGIYMHKIISTPREVDDPERFGFLHRQVVPFRLLTEDGEQLSSWLVLPPGLYRKHRDAIVGDDDDDDEPQQNSRWGRGGPADDVTATPNFRLLRDDPDARLVIFFHGNGGTLATGWRPDCCRALSAVDPRRLHVLAVDYRGFGQSTGSPSQEGLLRDGMAAVRWATETAGVPAHRIVLLGQSLGGAVSLMLADHLSSLSSPIAPAGVVTVGAFSSAADTLSEMWLEGVVPTLQPIAWCGPLFRSLKGVFGGVYPNKDWVAQLVRRRQPFHLTFLHAQDDEIVGHRHADVLFWTAVNSAAVSSGGTGVEFKEFEAEKEKRAVDLGHGGSLVEWRTAAGGVVRQEKPLYGGHAQMLSYPITTMAVMRALEWAEKEHK